MFKNKKIIVFTFLILGIGCNNQQVHHPQTPFEELNKLINSSKVVRINIDEIPVKQINLLKENVIYSVNNNNDFIGGISSITKTKNKFIFYDMATKAVYSVSFKGKLKGPLTREGKGPGEQNVVIDISSNSDFVYVSDFGNRRINIYDTTMRHLTSLPDIYSSVIDINEKLLLHINNQVFEVGDQLIMVRPLENLKETSGAIMPALIPKGYQPRIFNNTGFSINNQNMIAASYTPLSWLFLFNQKFELDQLLILEHGAFDTLDLAKMKLEKPKPGEIYGGEKPILNYKLLDNGDIFAALRNEIVWLSQKEDGVYEVAERISFEFPSFSKINNLSWRFLEVVGSSNDTLFIKNSSCLFWVKLSKE